MPSITKNAGTDGDLGSVTVATQNAATNTVTRYKFEIVNKHRERVRKTKSHRAQKYGGGAENPDVGGLCEGEDLQLQHSLKVVSGRHVGDGPDAVPRSVAQALFDAGARKVVA